MRNLLHCRLTKQVSAFYDDVLRLLSTAPLNQHFDKSWTSHVQVKATLYDVESQLQQAAQLHKDDDIAPEIARLKVRTCCTALHECQQTNTMLLHSLLARQLLHVSLTCTPAMFLVSCNRHVCSWYVLHHLKY